MSAIAAAQGRRHSVIQKMNIRIGQLNAEITRGTNGANGVRSDYLADRVNSLIGERERLEAEIDRLNQASDEDLISELVPEVAHNKALDENPPPPLQDLLTARGPMLPGSVVVDRQPPAVRREGGSIGIPWENQGNGVESGFTYTYDKAGNLVRA
jgi:uncharacterized small protein (DUF1192 family)